MTATSPCAPGTTRGATRPGSSSCAGVFVAALSGVADGDVLSESDGSADASSFGAGLALVGSSDGVALDSALFVGSADGAAVGLADGSAFSADGAAAFVASGAAVSDALGVGSAYATVGAPNPTTAIR
ncbi:hypothetical protein [Microlunatus ginsengisoli]|uniref:hypothetical protein n=1 Tax=Microlunatus ginsengisoli TaxID=363863 RepID=UPI0031DF53F9